MPLTPHKNYLSFALIMLLASTEASARSIGDTIARCAAIASVEDRIVCLEEALRQPTRDSAQEAVAPGTPVNAVAEGDDEVLDATTEETAAAPVVEADDILPATAEESANKTGAAPTAVAVGLAAAIPTASDDRTVATTPEPLAAESAADELGAAQVNGLETQKRTRIPVNVIDFRLVGTGRLRFTLDNGQVWQQTGDDDAGINRKLRRYESVPAEMWKARSGGYRIYLVPIDRTVRVRRLK